MKEYLFSLSYYCLETHPNSPLLEIESPLAIGQADKGVVFYSNPAGMLNPGPSRNIFQISSVTTPPVHPNTEALYCLVTIALVDQI